MCGIAGKVYFNNSSINERELKAMANAIAHRGPDDEGIYISIDKKVGLANRRLAIIDLSKKGHMPMCYKSRYIITFNGEVYNFQSERKALERSGYKFSSNTDTEVILALYDKYKEKCLQRLRGMFAFAIFDTKKDVIFLARDRIGKKPLKYFNKNGVFIFASELKAILTQNEVKREIDLSAVYHYLTFGYVPSPQTGFKDIFKLEPGHFMILNTKTGKLTKAKYWQPDYSKKLVLSFFEWKEKILAELEEAVKLRMVADVPIGAFLSGGVDSSAVVACMAKYSKKPVKTFTIGFKDKLLDESVHAKRIAEMYNTDHRELYVKPESVEILPELVYSYEEPYSDASAVVTYLVSKLARKEVKVILNGDGGDENFAGYDRYKRINRDVFLDHFESLLRPWGIPLSHLLAHSHFAPHFWQRAEKFLLKSMLPLADRFSSYIQIFSEEEKRSLYKRTLTKNSNNINSFSLVREVFKESGHIDPRNEALYWDLTKYLPEDLLVKVDIASMSVGLEARSPFIDHKMVELACKIPYDLKVTKDGQTKYILKKAVEKIIPKENIYRKKMGFSLPLEKWFAGDLNKYAKSKLVSKNAYLKNFFQTNYINTMLYAHGSNNDYGPKLWSLLTLELWLRTFFHQ